MILQCQGYQLGSIAVTSVLEDITSNWTPTGLRDLHDLCALAETLHQPTSRNYGAVVDGLYTEPASSGLNEIVPSTLITNSQLAVMEKYVGHPATELLETLWKTTAMNSLDIFETLASIHLGRSDSRLLATFYTSHSIFCTNHAFLGLAPPYAMRSDVLAMLDSRTLPIVLRPCGQFYRFVGFAFIPEYHMNGLIQSCPMPQGFDLI